MQEKMEDDPDLEQAMERTIGEEEGWRCHREGMRRDVNTMEVQMVGETAMKLSICDPCLQRASHRLQRTAPLQYPFCC